MRKLFLGIIVFLIFGFITGKDKNSVKEIATKQQNFEIVMLGNSLTHGGNWNNLLKRKDVFEFGIESDTLKGFIKRVNKIIEIKPKYCFIMGGINDIYKWNDNREIFKDYKTLIQKIKDAGIEPIIQSTLFAGKKYPHSIDRNKEVLKLNKKLKKYAVIRNLSFIDLNKKMSKDGFLTEDITWDGVHLNKNGYEIWGNELKKFLSKKK